MILSNDKSCMTQVIRCFGCEQQPLKHNIHAGKRKYKQVFLQSWITQLHSLAILWVALVLWICYDALDGHQKDIPCISNQDAITLEYDAFFFLETKYFALK